MAFTWDDEKREEVRKRYLEAEPTPNTSMEIVKEIADDIGATPNGVGAILRVEPNIYVKKEAAKAKSASTSTGEKKETKQESLDRLTAAIESKGLEADDSIVCKLTGKAAAYFADVISKETD